MVGAGADLCAPAGAAVRVGAELVPRALRADSGLCVEGAVRSCWRHLGGNGEERGEPGALPAPGSAGAGCWGWEWGAHKISLATIPVLSRRTGTCPAGSPWCGSSSRDSGSSSSSLDGSAQRYLLFSSMLALHTISFHLSLCVRFSLCFSRLWRADASHWPAFCSLSCDE